MMDDLTFKRLNEVNEQRTIEWTKQPTHTGDLSFRVIEFNGEAGEVSDAVKKLLRYMYNMKGGVDIGQSKINIGEELADTIICADRIAKVLDIDLGEAIIRKFNMTSDKYDFKTKL